MAKPIDAQTLAKARTQCPCVLDKLADTGMSDELIAVKMSDYPQCSKPCPMEERVFHPQSSEWCRPRSLIRRDLRTYRR